MRTRQTGGSVLGIATVSLLIVLVWSGGVAQAVDYPVLVETLEVSSLGPWAVYSQPLVAGQPYMFEASGVWIHDTREPDGALTDAEFGHERHQGVRQWAELSPIGDGTYEHDLMDLIINGAAVDWLGTTDSLNWAAHTFSPNHVYPYEWLGQGDSISFMIADHTPFGEDYYADNSGGLTVDIYTVPEPATLGVLALGALVAVRRRRSG